MGRLFLSFLGTSHYKACVYYKGEKPSPEKRKPVRFVQEAIIGGFCKGWGVGDRIVIFTTSEAYRKNWLDGGHEGDPAGRNSSSEGLKTRIAGLGLRPGLSVQNIQIPGGFSETEIWEIFTTVFNSIHRGDEVIFDITHAFRSIPMLAIVILSYARVLKKITINGIYYGAFDVLGNPRDVDRLNETDRLVPILDLTPIAGLLEWSVAVDRFVNSGDPAKVSELTKAGVQPILRDTRGADQAAVTLRDIANGLQNFCTVMSTCRGLKITESAGRLKSLFSALQGLDILPPFAPLFDIMQEKLNAFTGDALRDSFQAVKWCKEHGLIQQGFTILNEVLISLILHETTGDTQDLDKEKRKLPSQAAAIIDKELADRPECWKDAARKNEEITKRIIDFLEINKPIYDAIKNIKNLRNDLNHAGHRENAASEKTFAKALPEFIESTEKFIG
ncbi:MAG: TIGR02221 family CRISPR-associated protein [Desulfobacterales bacterium]